MDRAIEFYTKELSMDLLFKSRTPIRETGGKVAWLRSRVPNRFWNSIGILKDTSTVKSGLDHLAFQVDNVEDTYSRLIKRHEGALKPFTEGKWKLAFVKDPDGNWIELGEVLKKRKSDRACLSQ